MPMLRRLLQTGWRPPDDAPEELLEPAGGIDAVPVAPRWKVWAPKGHRKTFHGGPTRPPTMSWKLEDGESPREK